MYFVSMPFGRGGKNESYKKNTTIGGLNKITVNKSQYIFHSSTKKNEDHWLATGGRVLSISALGSTLKEARNKAYNVINEIDWKSGYYRNDIGWKHLT